MLCAWASFTETTQLRHGNVTFPRQNNTGGLDMFPGKRWSSGRSIAALFVLATGVPLATLFWLGWRVWEQDRALEDQQIRQRVERAADIAVAALERAVAASEKRLAAGVENWPEGAVVVSLHAQAVRVRPAERVAYLPVSPSLPRLPDAPFAAAEALEFRKSDFTGAAARYSELAHSRDPAVRAGALLRLARSLRSAGRLAEALPAYAPLLSVDGLAFEGVPVSLVARHARCAVMEALNQTAALRQEARVLAADAARWGAAPSPKHAERELLAEAVTALWQGLPASGPDASGREWKTTGEENVAVLWRRSGGRVLALVASRQFVAAQWLNAVGGVLQQERVKLAIQEGSGGLPAGAIRRAADTGLPWNVAVASEDPAAERAPFLMRRRLLMAGFGILVLLSLLAGYVIFRAISRELAVARLQSDFVAAVSHEFRTPLTSLRQFTDMLREHRGLSEERRNLCYEAQARATGRLSRLVESLLDFGRMEGGARLYRFQRHDCAQLVRDVVEEFRREPQAASFEIRVTANGSADIETDAEALGRALWNLLDNAVKYSGESRAIEVAIERRDSEVAISACDHGLGIPAHEQATIFRKFQRGEEARKRGIQGTGIGLAIVDHIMAAHRGRVELRSEPGRGSTFTLVLPARKINHGPSRRAGRNQENAPRMNTDEHG
jgi:signal transduction histidine kinase